MDQFWRIGGQELEAVSAVVFGQQFSQVVFPWVTVRLQASSILDFSVGVSPLGGRWGSEGTYMYESMRRGNWFGLDLSCLAVPG